MLFSHLEGFWVYWLNTHTGNGLYEEYKSVSVSAATKLDYRNLVGGYC